MSRAFYDDPVAMWILPDDDVRRRHMSGLFATMTRHHRLPGGGVEVACDGRGSGAAALWDPPNKWREPRWAQVSQVPMFLRVFGFRSVRARGVRELMNRAVTR